MHVLEIWRSKEAGGGCRQFQDAHRGGNGTETTRGHPHEIAQRPEGGRGRSTRGLVGGKVDGLRQGPPPGSEQEGGAEPDKGEATPAERQDLDAHKQERRAPGPAGLDRSHGANTPAAHV